MPHSSRTFIFCLVSSIALASIACSLGSLIPNLSQDATATSAGPAVRIMPGEEATPAISDDQPLPTRTGKFTLPTLESPEGKAGIADVHMGLDDLDSFRMKLTISLSGTDDSSKPVSQSLNLLKEVIKSKESMHLLMSGKGFSSDQFSGLEIYQIGKTGYMLTSGKDPATSTCVSFSNDKPAFDQDKVFAPDEMIGDIQRESLVARGETVNGVKTDHYKSSKASFSIGSATKQTGEVWIAQEGGYVVRYIGTGEGDFTLISSKVKGTATMTYDLTEVNKLLEILLPGDCQQANDALKDLPVPPNAANQANLGQMITFSSPDSTKVVSDYYRRELPAKGWTISKDSTLESIVMMTITKDTRQFQIMITPGDKGKGSSVVITKTN